MDDLTGKTIARVTERQMAARDTFQEWRDWTETTLHFTDGTTHSFAVDNTELYHPFREQLDCATCGDPVVESADYPGKWVHPFDGLADEDHEPRPVCKVDGAHCEDCGGRELRAVGFGVVCEDCGGDVVNPDECKANHP